MSHNENQIETAPDGRRYLAGMLRAYNVTTSGGQTIVLQGRNREQARARANRQLQCLETIVFCEARRPDIFPA
jgi:hypothetical protein